MLACKAGRNNVIFPLSFTKSENKGRGEQTLPGEADKTGNGG
jgi:hypothetical protein